MRAHRRPRPRSGRSPKCHGSAQRAQRPTSTAKSLLTTPFPKPHVRRSVGARAEGAWRVWVGLSSGWGTSDLYQTPQKAISVFFVPPPDLLLEDPVAGGPTPAWAPRRAMRRPDIHSVDIRPVFLPICKRSRIVRVGLQEGWYPPTTPRYTSRERACWGCLTSLGGLIERLGRLRSMPTPSELDFGLFGAGIEPSPAVFGRRWPHAALGAAAGYAES
jgi:hypothetical protein